MRLIQFGGCKIRAWHDELPAAFYDVDRIIEVSFEANAPGFNLERRAAVELHQLRSRLHYGLLGATLGPGETSALKLKVYTSSDDLDLRFAATLAHKSEPVYVGLPSVFANSIIEGASRGIGQLQETPAGEILFHCAAHSLVGSSEAVFSRLGATLISMLYHPEKDISLLQGDLCGPI